MKVLHLSDLHLDHNSLAINMDLLPYLCQFIGDSSPELVCIAGDNAGFAETALKINERITQTTGIPVVYVPGNHCVWTEPGESSWDRYQRMAKHSSSLIDRPRDLGNNWILIGDMGWYDYTFGDPMFNAEQFVLKKADGHKDGLYVHFPMSDQELFDWMYHKIEQQFHAAKEKKQNVVFVNHFVPYRDFVTVQPGDHQWNFNNAYMGSKRMGELCDAYENVKYVVFGHTHRRFGLMEYGDKMVLCNPMGYAMGNWTIDVFLCELKKSALMVDYK